MIYSLISKFVVLGSKKLKGGKPCLYVKHVIHVRNAHKITSQINLFSTTDLRNQQIRQHHILIYPFFQLSCTKYRQIQKEKQMSNIFRSDLELITEIEKQIGEGILHLEVEGDIAKVLREIELTKAGKRNLEKLYELFEQISHNNYPNTIFLNTNNRIVYFNSMFKLVNKNIIKY